MKKISYVLIFLAIISISMYFVFSQSNNKKNGETDNNWTVLQNDYLEIDNLKSYDYLDLNTIILGNMNTIYNYQYAINIPKDMKLKMYTKDVIRYQNDDLLFEYYRNVTDINSYDAYVNDFLSGIEYNTKYFAKYILNNDIHVYHLKFIVDNNYQEKIYFMIKEDKIYNRIDISINNKKMSNQLIKSIINSLKMISKQEYECCENDICEIKIDKDNPKILNIDIKNKNYVHNYESVYFPNFISFYKYDELDEIKIKANITMEYYDDKILAQEIFKDLDTVNLKIDNYSNITVTYNNNSAIYFLNNNDNYIIMVEVILYKDNADYSDVIKDLFITNN